MSTQEFAIDESHAKTEKRRVVEAEIRLPTWDELGLPRWKDMPQVDLEPVAAVAEEILLTTLGMGVLVGRGVVAVIRAAHKAGAEAAGREGSLTHGLTQWIHPAPDTEAAKENERVSVRVLPVDHYDDLSLEGILNEIGTLSRQDLTVLRAYEAAHANRAEVLEAIDARLSAA